MPSTKLTKKEDNKPIEWGKVYEDTPKKYIKTRQGRGSTQLAYVETGYIVMRLNELFNYMWDFEVLEESIHAKAKQVSVRGKLTIHLSPELKITKTQYGGANIKTHSSTGMPLSIADDLKAAASDALKKCASLIGIASDVYWGGEVDIEDDTESALEDTVEPQEVRNVATDPTLRSKQKLYFMVAVEAGYDPEKAKDLAKKAYKVESFNDIKAKQLEDLVDWMNKKIRKEKDIITDKDLDSISKEIDLNDIIEQDLDMDL
jgi:hypothetical protein